MEMVHDQSSQDLAHLTDDNESQILPLNEVQSVLAERLVGIDETDSARVEDAHAAAELLRSCVGATHNGAGGHRFRLRRLYVHALKHLRDVELWFPPRGSMLVRGGNESGKSTLLEAVYFSLYGAPLPGEQPHPALDDLLPRDGSTAHVELTLVIGGTTLEICRQLLPGSATGQATQEATLQISAQMPPHEMEEVYGPPQVNSRILREINELDGDALRMFCFLEQRRWQGIERLAKAQLGARVGALPAIVRLRSIEKDLQSAAALAREQIEQVRAQYEIASLQQAATDAELFAAMAEEQTHAARVRLLLDERDSRDTARELQEEQLATLTARHYDLRDRFTTVAAPQPLPSEPEQEQQAEIDEQAVAVELAKLQEQVEALQRKDEEAAALTARIGEQVVELLARHTPPGHLYYGSEPLDQLASDWPLLANVDAARLDSYEEIYRTASQEARQLRQSAGAYAQRYGMQELALDVEACSRRLVEVERRCRRYELAAEMSEPLRVRIIQLILTQTERLLQRLLPELTGGRYRTVELVSKDPNDSNADFSVAFWDEADSRQVANHQLSAGTRDQCSLALRLAVALAAFPQELSTVPGFILLDNPLDSFDEQRAQALVQIVTQGAVSQHFDQVVLSSHSQTIPSDAFRFCVDLENGRIRESNFPSRDAAEELWRSEDAANPAVPEA